MNIQSLAAIGLLALALGLPGCTGPDVKKPEPGSETTVVPNKPPEPRSRFTEACRNYCQHAEAMQCPEGAPLGDGTSCLKFCVDTNEAGHSMDFGCASRAANCEELGRCR